MLGQPGAGAWLRAGHEPDPGGEWRLWNMGGEMAWMKIPGYATGPNPGARPGAVRPRDPWDGWDAADWHMQFPVDMTDGRYGKRRDERLAAKISQLIAESKLKMRDFHIDGQAPMGWDGYWPSRGEARLVGDAFRRELFPWDDDEQAPNPYRWPNWNEIDHGGAISDEQYDADMAAEAQGQWGQ